MPPNSQQAFLPLSSPPSPVSHHLWPKPSTLSPQSPPGQQSQDPLEKGMDWSSTHAFFSLPVQFPLPAASLGATAASGAIWMNHYFSFTCPHN